MFNVAKPVSGFTLIELSIVLVIIGLIVGGVLVGQDLIRAAEIRAQISQIEKFNTATNTFYGKFSALPGDMNYQTAANFGFNTGATTNKMGCGGRTNGAAPGYGNGDGLFGGYYGNTPFFSEGGWEPGCFWVDISSNPAGNLIEGAFTIAEMGYNDTAFPATIPLYMPAAKIGRGNFIGIYTSGGINYFSLQNVTSIEAYGSLTSSGSLSPIQAYNIDKKIDDGYPNSGNVFAWYIGNGGPIAISQNHSPAAAGDCWDNGGTTPFAPFVGPQGTYATNINGGQGTNCGLSFKFQ
jgi:prepilin-type N-terminal cleavage/methylation domain-containing protein